MAKSYKVIVNFISDKALTEDELGLLYSQVLAQIEEPSDSEGNDAKYHTLILTNNSTIEENK